MIVLVFSVAAVVLLYFSRRPIWPPSRAADTVMWMIRLSLVDAVVWFVYWAAEPHD